MRMRDGRQRQLTLRELEAAALALSRRDQIALMRAIEANVFAPVDPEDLAEARRTIDDMKVGRVKAIPMEQVLDELDQMAEGEWIPKPDLPEAPPTSTPSAF